MKIYILVFLLMLCTTTMAQSISGTVKNSDGEIMPSATISLLDLKESTTTDMDGRYSFGHVPVGKHTIMLSYVGYESQTRDIDVRDNCSLDFTMKETSVMLNEVIVLPDGENMGLYLLRQVASNKKNLDNLVSAYNYTVNCRFETHTDTKAFPKSYLRMANIVAGLFGMKKIFVCIENYPDLRIEMAKDVAYSGGKKTASDIYLTAFKPDNLSDEEKNAFSQKDRWQMGQDLYRSLYKAMSRLYDKILKDVKKNKYPMDSLVTYEGCYNEGNHLIHIIKTRNSDNENFEIHVVNNSWQIRRIIIERQLQDKGMVSKTYGEFQELLSNMYLPVSIYQKNTWLLMEDKGFKKDKDKLDKTDTAQLSRGKIKKYQKKRAQFNRIAETPQWSCVYTLSYNYKNIMPQ